MVNINLIHQGFLMIGFTHIYFQHITYLWFTFGCDKRYIEMNIHLTANRLVLFYTRHLHINGKHSRKATENTRFTSVDKFIPLSLRLPMQTATV